MFYGKIFTKERRHAADWLGFYVWRNLQLRLPRVVAECGLPGGKLRLVGRPALSFVEEEVMRRRVLIPAGTLLEMEIYQENIDRLFRMMARGVHEFQ